MLVPPDDCDIPFIFAPMALSTPPVAPSLLPMLFAAELDGEVSEAAITEVNSVLGVIVDGRA